MNTLIKITDSEGREHWISLNHVIAFSPLGSDPEITNIILEGPLSVQVRGDVESVVRSVIESTQEE